MIAQFAIFFVTLAAVQASGLIGAGLYSTGLAVKAPVYSHAVVAPAAVTVQKSVITHDAPVAYSVAAPVAYNSGILAHTGLLGASPLAYGHGLAYGAGPLAYGKGLYSAAPLAYGKGLGLVGAAPLAYGKGYGVAAPFAYGNYGKEVAYGVGPLAYGKGLAYGSGLVATAPVAYGKGLGLVGAAPLTYGTGLLSHGLYGAKYDGLVGYGAKYGGLVGYGAKYGSYLL